MVRNTSSSRGIPVENSWQNGMLFSTSNILLILLLIVENSRTTQFSVVYIDTCFLLRVENMNYYCIFQGETGYLIIALMCTFRQNVKTSKWNGVQQ